MFIRPIRSEEVKAARHLLAANGWTQKVEDAAKFETLLQRSQVALIAIENDQVVGFIRAITDGIYNGYISMVVVAKEFQGRGVGSALMREAMGTNKKSLGCCEQIARTCLASMRSWASSPPRQPWSAEESEAQRVVQTEREWLATLHARRCLHILHHAGKASIRRRPVNSELSSSNFSSTTESCKCQ